MTAIGFDHNRGALIQLENLLNVSDGQFMTVKHTIKTLVSQRLSVDRQSRVQLDKLLEIEDQLRTLLPGVFDSTQKLAFARLVAMEYHRAARSRPARSRQRHAAASSRKNQLSSVRQDKVPGCRTLGKQRSQPSQLTFVPTLGTDTTSTPTSQRRALVDHRGLSSSRSSDSEYSGLTFISMDSEMHAISTRTSRQRALVNHRGSSSSQSSSGYSRPSEQEGDSPPHHPRVRDTGIDGPSYLPSSGHAQNFPVSACEPTVANREDHSTTTITSYSDSSCTSGSSHPMSYIHRFLQDCSPPLDHLLSRFVDLGFQNQGILREIAFIWSNEERRELMRRLAPGPMGTNITEVELAALERGFYALRSAEHQ